MTRARAFAIAGCVLAVIGAVGAVVVRIAAPVPFIPTTFGFGPAVMVAFITMGLSWAAIGALLVFRRPENAVGRIMVVVGAGYPLSMLGAVVTLVFVAEGTAEGQRLAELAGWTTGLFSLVGAFAFLIGFIFPTGRPQSPGWAWVVRLYWLTMLAFALIVLLQPGGLHLMPSLRNPFGVGPDLRGGEAISPFFAYFSALVFPIFFWSLASRYRMANRTERLQLKWLALSLAVSAAGLGLVYFGATLTRGEPGELGLTVYASAAIGVPVAIAIAILRYRLYEIDRIISRTISYGAITALLVAVFLLMNLALQSLLSSLTSGNSLAIAGSTLLAAAVFTPVRRRVQQLADRHFDRARYDTERTASAFSVRMRDATDLATVADDLDATVRRAIAPSNVGMWLRGSSR